jgi:hypothetical protein
LGFSLQSFLRSAILYCYFRKVSTGDNGEDELKRKLAEAEEENTRLKAVVAKHEDDLRVLGAHSAMMEVEASDASKRRDRALAELASMQEEIRGTRAKNASLQESHAALQAAHAELQEDHSILREELGQLEEKHNEALEQLKESRATVEKVSEGKLIAEERYKHFHGEHRKLSHGLRKAEEKAADYLRQLSFASRVRDAAWADGMYLGFETFRTWWKDPAQRIDLNSVNIEDIPCTGEAIRRLLSFGADEMPDAAGIHEFNYQPPVAEAEDEAEAADSEAVREVSAAAEAGAGPEAAVGGAVQETARTVEPHKAPQE